MRLAFLAVQALDGFENTRAHVAGAVPALLERGGFSVARIDRLRTLWGRLELLAATPSR
jgi:hypothetical protein